MLERIDALIRRIDDSMREPHQTQRVTYRIEGMGKFGIVFSAVCAILCVMCVLFLILGAIFVVPDIHDLKAWEGIINKDIARLQAEKSK